MSDIIDTKGLMTIVDNKNFENFSLFFFLSNNYYFKERKRRILNCRVKKKCYSFVSFTFQVSNSPIIQGLNPFACFVLGIIIPFHDPVVVAQG